MHAPLRPNNPLILAALLGLPLAAGAGTINQIGIFANWPTTWTPLTGLNDPAGEVTPNTDPNPIAGRVDFVGNAANPAAYYANEGGYLFFRMRTNTPTVTGTFATGPSRTYKDTLMVAIDVVGSTVNTSNGQLIAGETSAQKRKPDYALSWDSNLSPLGHGLEMQMAINYFEDVWGNTSLQDLDLIPGGKGSNDINGNSRTTDGYVRTIDQQTTTNLGTTSFVDLAVSWSYLTAYTGLRPDQTWNITLASIQFNNDHSNITADVAGGATVETDVNSPNLGWAPVSFTPVPPSLSLLGLGLAAMGWMRRRAAG